MGPGWGSHQGPVSVQAWNPQAPAQYDWGCPPAVLTGISFTHQLWWGHTASPWQGMVADISRRNYLPHCSRYTFV